MATLDEVIAQAAANIEAVNEAVSGVEGTKNACEEVVNTGQGVGSESLMAGGESMKDQLEQAQAALAGVVSQLESVQSQAESLKT